MIQPDELRIDTYSPGFSGNLWMRLTYIPLGLVVEGERKKGTAQTRKAFREAMLHQLQMKINKYHEDKRLEAERLRHAPYDPKDFTSSSWYGQDVFCTIEYIPTGQRCCASTYDLALDGLKYLLRKGNPTDGDGDSLENY